MIPLYLIGGGGHARVVIDAARASGAWKIQGILDDVLGSAPREVDGVPVVGLAETNLARQLGIEHATIAIGDNAARAAIADRFADVLSWCSVGHPRACIAPLARIGAGAMVGALAVVQPGARIGDHVILNTASSVDHDSLVGRFTHIGPGARICGSVQIGAGVLVGVGASVAPGVRIGSGAIIGAGAAVVDDVPADSTAVGVPARVVKRHGTVWTESGPLIRDRVEGSAKIEERRC